MKNNAIITGTDGSIELLNPWMPGRDGGPYHAKIIINKNNQVCIKRWGIWTSYFTIFFSKILPIKIETLNL